MSISITDQLTQLTKHLTPDTGVQTNSPPRSGNIFATRLQQALDSTATDSSRSTPDKAKAMAQLLNLQMLQSSLSLSGQSEDAIDRQKDSFSPVQALLGSYRANSTEQSNTQNDPAIGPTSDKNASFVQLQELGNSISAASTAVQDKVGASITRFESIVVAASQRYGVDAGLIKAVIKAESNFNPRAVSHAGAQGLMQLMPGTARSLGVSDSFDPEQNVMGGTRFLRDMLKRYDGNIDSALAAYNWGPGNVDRRPDSLPRETRDYQARVKQLYAMYSA